MSWLHDLHCDLHARLHVFTGAVLHWVSLDCSACLPRWQLLLLVYQSSEQQYSAPLDLTHDDE